MKTFIWLVLFINVCTQVFISLAGNAKSTHGPTHYVEIGNQTFYILDTNVTALEARQLCNEENNMKLISFENEDKYLLIVNYLEYNTSYSEVAFWTSGRKFLSKWEWSSQGRFFTYEHWFAGQPDNNDPCDFICVLFRSQSGWYDSPCLLGRGFICEF